MKMRPKLAAGALACATGILLAGSTPALAATEDAAAVCSTSGLGDPNNCTQAVAWAKAHVHTTYNADYYRYSV